MEAIRLALRNIFRPALRRFGYDMLRYTDTNFAELRRARIMRQSGITLVLDVGGHVGRYGEMLRNYGYRGRMISFEPRPGPFSELEQRAAHDPLWEGRALALGETDGTITINVSKNSRQSSLLPLTERTAADKHIQATYVGQETVGIARLDTLRPEIMKPDDRVYMKIDVQGYEMKVLEGAVNTLPQIQALEIELSFVSLYEGQPLLCDMVTYLNSAGYDLVSVDPGYSYPENGHILQMDGIFLRRQG